MSLSSSASPRPKVLSRLVDDEVLHRTVAALNELHPVVAREATGTALLLGGPQSGKTELLRLAFDRLFAEHRRALPFYFTLRRDRLTPEKFAKDFVTALLRHYLAFTRRDADLVLRTDLTERDLLNLAEAVEFPLLKEALEGYEARVADGDEAALVRYALAAPQRVGARSPYNVVVLLDEAQWLDRVALAFGEDGAALLGEAAFSPQPVSFVLAGQQRALLDQLTADGNLLGACKIIHLAPPETAAVQALAEQWCVRAGVPCERETLRLVVQQTDGNLAYLRALVAAAGEQKVSLRTGADFERLYVAQLLQGRLAHQFSGLMRRLAQDASGGVGVEHAALEAVAVCAEAITSRPPVEMIERRVKARVPASQLLQELHYSELVSLLDGHVLPPDDPVLCDWVEATQRRFAGAPLEEVRLDLLRRRLKGVPALLALHARRSLHARLEALLKRFNGQSVARSLFAHDEFVIRYGRATYENMLAGLQSEAERVELPQIVHVAESHLFAPKPAGGATVWSCLLAYGFDGGIYDQEHEIIWLLAAAEAPSAVDEEAVLALDYQLRGIEETLASGEHQPRLMRWAISKMGFTPDGAVALEERGFAASDYLQLELLTACLNALDEKQKQAEGGPASDEAEAAGTTLADFDLTFDSHRTLATTPAAPEPPPAVSEPVMSAPDATKPPVLSRDFEIAIPMNDDKEIIAARVAEQMARGAGFAQEAVNQIKTALIESCLSLAAGDEDPAGRIHQRYHVDDKRMTITASNTAAGLDAEGGTALEDDPERVWRLDVLRSLVDEVRLTKFDGGYRVVLTRYVR